MEPNRNRPIENTLNNCAIAYQLNMFLARLEFLMLSHLFPLHEINTGIGISEE